MCVPFKCDGRTNGMPRLPPLSMLHALMCARTCVIIATVWGRHKVHL